MKWTAHAGVQEVTARSNQVSYNILVFYSTVRATTEHVVLEKGVKAKMDNVFDK
jgi:hypothetical protein